MQNIWQLQEAKSKLSEFVNKAKLEPQIISRNGTPEIVALSIDKYRELVSKHSDIVSLFHNSPLYGVELDLSRDTATARKVDL
jgi:prevent-host-death family protein